MIHKEIRNLIFDLGGVIIDLDFEKLIKEMSSLTGISAEKIRTVTMKEPSFNNYEKGLISNQEFRNFIHEQAKKPISDDQIDEAWNSILLDIPLERLEMLTRLKGQYNVFLLSNTNDIHLRKINTKLKEMGYEDFEPFFHGQYYSHILHERKPDKRIYEIVLQESGIMASESLFLDDSLINLEGAEKLGINTFHVTHPDLVLELFNAK